MNLPSLTQPGESKPADSTSASVEGDFRIPRRFNVKGTVQNSSIRQLAFIDHTRRLTMSSFTKGRTSGHIGVSAAGRTIFFCEKPTKAALPYDEILCTPGCESVEQLQSDLPESNVSWQKPKVVAPLQEDMPAAESRRNAVLESWVDKFEFQEEQEVNGIRRPGLRRPQIGALHATIAHWTVTPSSATVVMPTGTGKTETMLALLVCARIDRLLVIVPNSALRDQLAEKFLTLGVLEESGCLLPGAALPVVASLYHRPASVDEVDNIFRRANVIVTTMQIAGQCSQDVQERMAALCSHLFIDEAHHIAARTWNEFKQRFSEKAVVQFTATPFRTDGKRIDGKFIYTYPLGKAQREGYFKHIVFVPITEYDVEQSDVHIAERAGQRLRSDLEAGLDHVLMARVDTIARADIVFAIYSRELADLNPVLIHSNATAGERRSRLESLRQRESRVVVCVDMFGEGFDFPELKIAALHDRHKSLAITLQFIGRFTRTNKPNIGDAAVIANVADDAIEGALRSLYAEDADWNFLLRMLSEGATTRARKRAEVIEGFTGALPDIPLQTLYPRMSAVVYRTTCEQWEPTKVEDAIPGAQLYAGPLINPQHNLAVFVTRDEELVRWGAIKQIQNVEWNLYVLHWNEELGLLFVNSSKPKDFHEGIAKAVTGSEERIVGETVFRSLGGIRRLALTNLGLTHAFGKNIRYTMFMGADIAEGLTEAARANKRKSNLFGLGYEEDEKVTMGCSFKGRLWSHKIAYDLSEWIEWCKHVGRKLLDARISTDEVFANLIKARGIAERPPLVPVMVSWPEGFAEQAENLVDLQIGALVVPFFECDITVPTHTDVGPLRFEVVIGPERALFELVLSDQGAQFQQVAGNAAYAQIRGRKKLLSDWFNSDPPIVYFATGDFLVFNELFELPQGAERRMFGAEKMIAWDWSGIDIKNESQGETKDATSIQRRVVDTVLRGDFGDFDIVFDDDGSGEIADVVAIRRDERRMYVHLFHCKFSSEPRPGARVEDLYDVCGQAQKCVRWREDARKLLKHLLYRDDLRTRAGKPSRFEKGSRYELQQLVNLVREMSFEYHVHIVQPGLSISAATTAHTDLLGATASFLKETYSMPLDIIGSA